MSRGFSSPELAVARMKYNAMSPKERRRFDEAARASERNRRLYARGGRPPPKAPSMPGDFRDLEAAQAKRERRATKRLAQVQAQGSKPVAVPKPAPTATPAPSAIRPAIVAAEKRAGHGRYRAGKAGGS